ncbi:hypothetical protein IR148_16020 [Dysgonomonas mossii]|uniref:Uncharacterized protein n=1 Tax=Dysgonomonas mossii TaxID=163665 RepID=A0A4Y9IIN0_9BACT|nr:hypothetical protein [Dysgonomonas mossii]MBF0762547.1 hypothetical protein [Dysgonomonas mossii]TFU86952.1 hypothetical protein E4T88_16000 [Dysgonomonas mossii]
MTEKYIQKAVTFVTFFIKFVLGYRDAWPECKRSDQVMSSSYWYMIVGINYAKDMCYFNGKIHVGS